MQALAPLEAEDLDERERASKDILSRCVERLASPQPVFYGLRRLFAKGAQWICGWVEAIGVRLQERRVTSSKACKVDRIRTVANFPAIF